MNSFMISSYQQVLLGDAIKGSEVVGACGVEIHTWCCWGHIRERNHLEDKNIGEDNSKVDLK